MKVLLIKLLIPLFILGVFACKSNPIADEQHSSIQNDQKDSLATVVG